jgi:signal peptidase I
MDTPHSIPGVQPPEALPIVDQHSTENNQLNQSSSSTVTIRSTSNGRLLLTIGSGLISAFLFIRVFAIEPFGVPTGSMAPALIGNHREGACPRCDFPVRVGFPPAGVSPESHFATVVCPNCGQQFSMVNQQDLNGDRLLVDKNVFNLRKPRRWEMAVFHCPDSDPKELGKPYVKRVVGLPGETIVIKDGEVYANGELLRKGYAEVREMRILDFDMNYVPKQMGWSNRWLIDEHDPRLPNTSRLLPCPADNKTLQGSILRLNADQQVTTTATYRNWNLDHQQEEPIRSWNSYDGLPRSFGKFPAVHEFSFTSELEVTRVTPEASIIFRLTDGVLTVSARVVLDSQPLAAVSFEVDGNPCPLPKAKFQFIPGRKYSIEYLFVDRRVSFIVDGKPIGASLDLPSREKSQEVSRPLSISVQGCQVVFSNIKLYRDVYYTQFGANGTLPPGNPVTLGPGQYYLLGDNSANSQDSRKWAIPGVPETGFIGKPFLIHQPLRAARVTIGGRERVIQTIDWTRLRWLH